MITVAEAKKIVFSQNIVLETEDVPFDQVLGKILAEDVVADRPFPPFNRVMSDGIAIDYEALQEGIECFVLKGIQTAGEIPKKVAKRSHAIEMMTGAVLPDELNTVVPYELLSFEEREGKKIVFFDQEGIKKWYNVHQKGSDKKQNEVLIPAKTWITPAEIGILASVGKHRIKVYEMPKVALVSSGNELVDIDDIPLSHQIRRSNSYTLGAALKEIGINVDIFHIPDDKNIIAQRLKYIIRNHDVVIISGGVSKGKFDFVPSVLKTLEIEESFHEIAQRPARHIWFGVQENKKAVFGISGNPVSAFMSFHVYIKPFLFNLLHTKKSIPQAILTENVVFEKNLTCFVQVKVSVSAQGELLANPIIGSGSGDLTTLNKIDGFLELPYSMNIFKVGEKYPLHLFRPIF